MLLSPKLAAFGERATALAEGREPGGFDTDWAGASAVRATELAAYAEAHEASRNRPTARAPKGDPTATREALMVADLPHPFLELIRAHG